MSSVCQAANLPFPDVAGMKEYASQIGKSYSEVQQGEPVTGASRGVSAMELCGEPENWKSWLQNVKTHKIKKTRRTDPHRDISTI